MKKILFSSCIAIVALATPAMAFYTECTVTRDINLATRPSGPSEPRYMHIDKGDKVAFRDRYQGWWFVMHAKDGAVDYGWVPQDILSNCTKQEGTP